MPGGRLALIPERPGRHQQAAAGLGDHAVARCQVLEVVVGDRAHALGHCLVLHDDAFDPREAAVALLVAVDQVVVLGVLHRPPAAEPVGRVGLHRQAARSRAGKGIALAVDAGMRAPAFPDDVEHHGVPVVHRDPGAVSDLVAERAFGRDRPERKHEVCDAPVGLVALGLAPGAVHGAPVGFGRVVFRRAVDRVVFRGRSRVDVLRLDRAVVQPGEMRGVDVALQRLHPVAFALDAEQLHIIRGQQRRLELGQRRRLLRLAHIDPDQAVALLHRIRFGAHLILEILMLGQVRHVGAASVGIELPAVVDAADAAFLVAAEEQRGAAMRAAVIHDPDLAR